MAEPKSTTPAATSWARAQDTCACGFPIRAMTPGAATASLEAHLRYRLMYLAAASRLEAGTLCVVRPTEQ